MAQHPTAHAADQLSRCCSIIYIVARIRRVKITRSSPRAHDRACARASMIRLLPSCVPNV
eukprot:3011-Heterococcus_DN1.PRE.5